LNEEVFRQLFRLQENLCFSA